MANEHDGGHGNITDYPDTDWIAAGYQFGRLV
jgi:hypothetical protein